MVLNIAQNLNILYVCPNIANINCWKLLLFRTYKCRIWFLFVLGIIKESEDRMSICYSLTLILWMRCTIAMHLCSRLVLLCSSRQVTGLGLIWIESNCPLWHTLLNLLQHTPFNSLQWLFPILMTITYKHVFT